MERDIHTIVYQTLRVLARTDWNINQFLITAINHNTRGSSGGKSRFYHLISTDCDGTRDKTTSLKIGRGIDHV